WLGRADPSGRLALRSAQNPAALFRGDPSAAGRRPGRRAAEDPPKLSPGLLLRPVPHLAVDPPFGSCHLPIRRTESAAARLGKPRGITSGSFRLAASSRPGPWTGANAGRLATGRAVRRPAGLPPAPLWIARFDLAPVRGQGLRGGILQLPPERGVSQPSPDSIAVLRLRAVRSATNGQTVSKEFGGARL